ncbi:(2E,6E)-farnesyl diphosphate synthase [Maricurvus nonylphenolicus]|uniref:(2E,6E)-farnesyl diphosphate synthase n=1 Tax=Maricurvus nonylphenolicus TaxID=1008307 RepID=UPI0036F380BB
MSQPFEAFLAQSRQQVDNALTENLPSPDQAGADRRLFEAMHYSTINGGKRLRPVLVYAAAASIAEDKVAQDILDRIACAVECIHAYSLVHDDLPAMDDDDLRRGQPTCHIAFDEATAVLAGDALQGQAFELLSTLDTLTPHTQLDLVRTLAQASGAQGMVGGQAIDLASVDKQLTLDALQTMHNKKTGALIKASVLMGAIATQSATAVQLQALSTYADAIGLAFQVQDDILDVIADTATLGKRQGADEALNKPTYVSLLGLEGAQAKTQELHQQAIKALENFGEGADLLRQLSAYIVERGH